MNAGITPHPNEPWMIQVARNVTMADVGFLSSSRYLIHDRDSKFCESFRDTIEGVGVTPVRLPARSPELNAFAERWVRSVKEECLSKLILFGENSARHALKEYVAHHHHERNHQGTDNLLLFPEPAIAQTNGLEGAIQRVNGLAGCSVSTIGKPHEYLDPTGWSPRLSYVVARRRTSGLACRRRGRRERRNRRLVWRSAGVAVSLIYS